VILVDEMGQNSIVVAAAANGGAGCQDIDGLDALWECGSARLSADGGAIAADVLDV
jgi:hypothetical protein